MIANLRPDNLGLLDCVVEECDERFSAEQQEEMVGIIGHVLGREAEGGDDVNGSGVNGVDGEVVSGKEMNGVDGEGVHVDEMEEDRAS